MIRFGPYRYDPESRILYRDDEEILLSPRVLAVLESLLKRPGKVVPKEDLLASAWDGAFVEEASVTQAISELRQILDDDPQQPTYIQTIRGRGYRFIAAVSPPLGGGPEPGPGPPGWARESPDPGPIPSVEVSPDRREPLREGSRLGRYEIVAPAGAGAMGEVWRARDHELDREVALKLVPPAFASDPEAMQRLRREARLLAAVVHPNVAAIHTVEEVERTRFIVMELVEGKTLLDRLEGGPLRVDEALDVALQIAEGLEVVHDRGIVHRDLKPGNVAVTDQGEVKLLDFGLAKEVQPRARDPAAEPISLTKPGAPLGTTPYMSPEQVRAQEVDERTDIWAFGCLLYEMLAGRRAFAGGDAQETLAAILRDDPDWEALPAELPGQALRALKRCLDKDLARRLHHIADARIELEDAVREPATAHETGRHEERGRGPRRPHLRRVRTGGIGLLLLAAGIVVGSLLSGDRLPEATRLSARFDFAVPEGLSLDRSNEFAVSPTGDRIVFKAEDQSDDRLWVRRIGETGIRPIPGTEGAYRPFFAPDGERIGFFTRDALNTVGIEGGRPHRVADAFGNQSGMSASWGEDDVIVFGHTQDGLFAVNADGGEPRELTQVDPETEIGHYLPLHLPETRYAVFTTLGGGLFFSIELLNVDTGRRIPLIEDARGGYWLDSGHLVAERQGDLYAFPFDRESLTASAETTPIVRGVAMAAGDSLPAFAAAGRTIVWVSEDQIDRTSSVVRWTSAAGPTRLSRRPRGYRTLDLSPEGQRLLMVDHAPGRGFILTSGVHAFAPAPVPAHAEPYAAIWGPAGGITYATREIDQRRFALYHVPAGMLDDLATHELLHTSANGLFPISWDSQGTYLVFNEAVPDRTEGVLQLMSWGVFRYSRQSRVEETTGDLPGSEWGGDLAPDDAWIAYSKVGNTPVYVEPFPDRGQPIPVGEALADHPRWGAQEGGQLTLYFMDEDAGEEGMLTRVRLEVAETGLRVSAFEPLLSMLGYRTGYYGFPAYDVGPDGAVYLLRRNSLVEPTTISVLVNPAAASR